MQGEGRKLIRNVKWLGVGVSVFLAVLTPFSRAMYGVPWTIPGLLVWATVIYLMLRWAKRTEPYREAAPEKDAPIIRRSGRWYALVSWRLPLRQWKWSRVRERETIVASVGLGGAFLAMWAVITVVDGFNPVALMVFGGMAAFTAGGMVLGAVGWDTVAVGVD